MKRIQFLVLLSCFVPATFCYAQSNTDEVDVAILDVAKVFDQDRSFSSAMEDLKKRANHVRNNQNNVNENRTKELSAELKALETKAYTECYMRMQKVVGKVSKQHGIKIVIRADTGSIDMEDRAEVIKRINSPVVYHHRLDLTAMVIDGMKKSSTVSTKSESLPKRTPKFCDQCGHALSTGITECLCLDQLMAKEPNNETGNSADQ